MEPLELVFGSCQLTVTLESHESELPGWPGCGDWLNCRVTVEAPPFHGTVSWFVQPSELAGLANDLQGVYQALPECR